MILFLCAFWIDPDSFFLNEPCNKGKERGVSVCVPLDDWRLVAGSASHGVSFTVPFVDEERAAERVAALLMASGCLSPPFLEEGSGKQGGGAEDASIEVSIEANSDSDMVNGVVE